MPPVLRLAQGDPFGALHAFSSGISLTAVTSHESSPLSWRGCRRGLPPWLRGCRRGCRRRASLGATFAAPMPRGLRQQPKPMLAHATKAAYESSTYGCRPKMILLSWATAAAPFWQCSVRSRAVALGVNASSHCTTCPHCYQAHWVIIIRIASTLDCLLYLLCGSGTD